MPIVIDGRKLLEELTGQTAGETAYSHVEAQKQRDLEMQGMYSDDGLIDPDTQMMASGPTPDIDHPGAALELGKDFAKAAISPFIALGKVGMGEFPVNRYQAGARYMSDRGNMYDEDKQLVGNILANSEVGPEAAKQAGFEVMGGGVTGTIGRRLATTGRAMAPDDATTARIFAGEGATSGRQQDFFYDDQLDRTNPFSWGSWERSKATGLHEWRPNAIPGVDPRGLDSAKAMLGQGADPKKVWADTGWAYHPRDKAWYFEIDDSSSHLMTPDDLAKMTGKKRNDNGIVKDFLKHDRLFDQYPEAADIPVEFSYRLDTNQAGGFDTDAGKIIINAQRRPIEMRNTLLHELQHWVQQKEGWNSGANTSIGKYGAMSPEERAIGKRNMEVHIPRMLKLLDDTAKGPVDKIEAVRLMQKPASLARMLHNKGLIEKEVVDDLDAWQRVLNSQAEIYGAGDPRRAAFNLYQRNVGETAARNTGSQRPSLGPATRREMSPWETQDFGYQDQFDDVPSDWLADMRKATNSARTEETRPLGVYDMPAGSDPRYTGAAPDRTDKTFLRYTPVKGASERVNKSLAAMRDKTNPARRQMTADIKRGLEIGGRDWYNTEELRDWFVKELGEERGHAEWSQFMDLLGTTSPGSKVDANIASASAVRNRLMHDPEYARQAATTQKLADAGPMAASRPKGYGHKTAKLQELATSRLVQGRWGGAPEPGMAPSKGSWLEQPKPKGFSQSLKGSRRNIAGDLHYTRYFGMAARDPAWLDNAAEVGYSFRNRLVEQVNRKADKYFEVQKRNGKDYLKFRAKDAVDDGVLKMDDIADEPTVYASLPADNEYGAMEAFMSEIGDEMGLTPHQVQASLWMGAADRTGVDPTSQGTFMELIRRRADKTAAKEGKNREQVFRNFVRNGGLLSLPAGIFASQEDY